MEKSRPLSNERAANIATLLFGTLVVVQRGHLVEELDELTKT